MFSEKPHIYLPGESCSEDNGIDELARWEWTEEALTEFDELKKFDEGAYWFVVENLKRWNRYGYDQNDPCEDKKGLDTPAGREARSKVPEAPWLGEIREAETPFCRNPGKKKYREYRLYFIDLQNRPAQPQHQMLITMVREKKFFWGIRGLNNKKTRDKQTCDMAEAMERGIQWCSSNQIRYRSWKWQ